MRVLVSERAQVLAFLRCMVRNPDVAEDLFQNVCVLALEKREAIQDEHHLRKWMRTTGRLEAMNFVRRRGNLQKSLDSGLLELLESSWDELDADDSALRAAALRDCMDQLPPPARELVRKRYFEGIRYPQIAASLGRSVESLYVTFRRIHVALADCVSKRLANGVDHG